MEIRRTYSLIKAIRIIYESGPINPTAFAKSMWPDSEGWRHHTKCGPKGSRKGGGMSLAGGGYLGRLDRLGLIRRTSLDIHFGYILTPEGLKICKEVYG